MMKYLRNNHRTTHICKILLIFVVFCQCLPLSIAEAQVSSPVQQHASLCQKGEYQQSDTWQGTILVLSCTYATAHDTITIYPNSVFDQRLPWQQNTNDQDATWIFDAGAQGRASLIINFHRVGAALVADLYDDQNGDSKVDYSIANRQVQVDESHFWTVQVVAKDGWWQRDEKVNFNLDISVDGSVLAAFQAEAYQSRMMNDGREDFHITINDANHNDKPDDEIIQATPPVPDEWGIYRTLIMVNPGDDEVPITNNILWPYLGTVYGQLITFHGGADPTIPLTDTQGRSYGIVKTYGQSFPPIQVNWSKGHIGYIGEFVASRANDHNWFTYSIKRIIDNQNVTSNFEAPFVFYDLANDNDHFPELQVRNEYFSSSDFAFEYGSLAFPTENIRYSWDQDNDNHFDYKVDLVGRYEANDMVRIPGLSFRTIDPKNIATWVISKPWDGATFVAVEGKRKYTSTEGIYEYYAVPIRRYYMQGEQGNFHNAFTTIKEGLRGEYRASGDQQANLYFSPVDHKLHLLKANAGIWTIDSATSMRYTNTSKSDYIDQWTYTHIVTGSQMLTETKQLTIADPYMIYTDGDHVLLRQAAPQPFVFKTLPPTNNAEWLELGAKLEANKREIKPEDVQAMFEQFHGTEIQIDGAAMRDYRATGPHQFRFVLDVQPNYALHGQTLAPFENLAPGSYVVVYDGQFSVQPATPPNLHIRIVFPSGSSHHIAQPISVLATITNTGTEDANTIILVVDGGKGSGLTRVARIPVKTVPASGSVQIPISWAPLSDGQWTLRATLFGAQDTYILQAEKKTPVVTLPEENSGLVLALTSHFAQIVPLVFLLATLALVSTLVIYPFWSARRIGELG